MVLAFVPLYAFAQHTTSPRTQQGRTFGDLQPRSISAGVTGLSHNGMSLNIKAVIYNPSGFGATIETASYSVYANGHYLGEGQLAHEYSITPQSSQTLVFPISIGWRSAFLATGSYIVDLGDIAWKVNGTVSIEVGGFPLSVPFAFASG
jgi:LEA14-like dessication related protein